MPVPSKTIGLIGGMSWESTLPYYRIINQRVRHACGGLHSAKVLLYSVNFHEIERLQHAGDWDGAGRAMAAAARALHAGGADFLVLCTNTMHCVADAITSATPLPLLHIADATAEALIAAGVTGSGCSARVSPWNSRSIASAWLRVACRCWYRRPTYARSCIG